MTAKPNLTDLDVQVLRAAARDDGSLYRSEGGYPYHSMLWPRDAGPDRAGRRNVNRQADKLCQAGLLTLGERDRFIRPWLLTAAGRVVLDAHPEEQL